MLRHNPNFSYTDKYVLNNPGSYLLHGLLDQTDGPSVSFTIATNGISLTEQTILVKHPTKITCNKDDPFSVVKFSKRQFGLTGHVSMVEDTDWQTVWCDGPRNKYDSGFSYMDMFEKMRYNRLISNMFWTLYEVVPMGSVAANIRYWSKIYFIKHILYHGNCHDQWRIYRHKFFISTYCTSKSTDIYESILALKPRGRVIRSSKQRVPVARQMALCSSIFWNRNPEAF